LVVWLYKIGPVINTELIFIFIVSLILVSIALIIRSYVFMRYRPKP